MVGYYGVVSLQLIVCSAFHNDSRRGESSEHDSSAAHLGAFGQCYRRQLATERPRYKVTNPIDHIGDHLCGVLVIRPVRSVVPQPQDHVEYAPIRSWSD